MTTTLTDPDVTNIADQHLAEVTAILGRLARYAAYADPEAIRALYEATTSVVIAAAPEHQQTQLRLAAQAVIEQIGGDK